MSVPFLDLTEQYRSIRDEVDDAIRRVVDEQYFILGPEVEGLEAEVADYVGTEHAVSCNSGTDALLLGLKALEPEEGDEVILPSFTFFATAGAAWNAGFTPVFCDVDRDTFNVTAGTVETALTERTRAVVPVHLYGQMAPMSDLMELAREHDLFVFEDVAQALGARQRITGEDVRGGAAGHAGAFSFFPTKNLGGFGDGGLVTTDDDAFAERVAKLRVHGGKKMYHHEMVGTNSRLDALQAAVLRAKLPHVDDWLAGRRKNACTYDGRLADVDEIRLPYVPDGNFHTYNQYTVRAMARNELREHLSARDIGTGLYYPVPLHLQDCFSELGYGQGDLPVSEMLCEEVLSLPVYPELQKSEIAEVTEAIREFYGT